MVPMDIKIYAGVSSFRVRPYVDNVLQCFKCFRIGHLAKHCRSGPVCIACGEQFHGNCNLDYKCSNCGGCHKPTNKQCEVYLYNKELKRIMAMDNVNIQQAKDILRNRQSSSRDPLRRSREDIRRSNEKTFSIGYIKGRYGHGSGTRGEQ